MNVPMGDTFVHHVYPVVKTFNLKKRFKRLLENIKVFPTIIKIYEGKDITIEVYIFVLIAVCKLRR